MLNIAVISIRLNDEKERILKNYTKSKRMTISQYIKNILFAEIEEEFDLEVCKDYLERKEKNK